MSIKTAKGKTPSKKELAEAGRKKLEAFRKKKAAEKLGSKHAESEEIPVEHTQPSVNLALPPLPCPPKGGSAANGFQPSMTAPLSAGPQTLTDLPALPVERQPVAVAHPPQPWNPPTADSNGALTAVTAEEREESDVSAPREADAVHPPFTAPVATHSWPETMHVSYQDTAMPSIDGHTTGNSTTSPLGASSVSDPGAGKVSGSTNLVASGLSHTATLDDHNENGDLLKSEIPTVLFGGPVTSQQSKHGDDTTTGIWDTTLPQQRGPNSEAGAELQGAASHTDLFPMHETAQPADNRVKHFEPQHVLHAPSESTEHRDSADLLPEPTSVAQKTLPKTGALPLPPSFTSTDSPHQQLFSGQSTDISLPTSSPPLPGAAPVATGAQYGATSQRPALPSSPPQSQTKPSLVQPEAPVSRAPPLGPLHSSETSASLGVPPVFEGPRSFGKPPTAFSKPLHASAKYVQPPWNAASAAPAPASEDSISKLIIPGPRLPEQAKLFVPSVSVVDSIPDVVTNLRGTDAPPMPYESQQHRVNGAQVEKSGGFSSMFRKLADTVAPSAPTQHPTQQTQATVLQDTNGTASVSSTDSTHPGRASVLGRFANAVVSAAAPPVQSAAPASNLLHEGAVSSPNSVPTVSRASSLSPNAGGSAPGSVGKTGGETLSAAQPESNAYLSSQARQDRSPLEPSLNVPSSGNDNTATGEKNLQIHVDGSGNRSIPHSRSRSLFGRLAEAVSEVAAPAPQPGSVLSTKGHSRTDSSAWLDELVATNLGQDALGSHHDQRDSSPLPTAVSSEPDTLVIPSWVGGEPTAASSVPSTSNPQAELATGVPPSRKGSLSSKYSMLSDSYISKAGAEPKANPAKAVIGNGLAHDPSPNIIASKETPESNPKLTSNEGASPVGDSAVELATSPSLPVSSVAGERFGNKSKWSGPPSTSSHASVTSFLPPPAPTSNGGQFSKTLHADQHSFSLPPVSPISWASLPKAPPSVGKDSVQSSSGTAGHHRESNVEDFVAMVSDEGHASFPSRHDEKPHASSRSDTPKHSRRESRDVLPSVDNSSQFKELQQYIDDLTQEKYELQRGMEQQSKLAASLASENEQLTQDFNNMGSVVQDLRKQIEKYESEIGAQMLALDSLARERDGSRSGAVESGERAKALASEVVSLEEQVLQMRSNELRIGKQLERAQEAQAKTARQLTAVQKERKSLQQDMETLKEEKLALAVKLRRATVAAQLGNDSAPNMRPQTEAIDTASQTDAVGISETEASTATAQLTRTAEETPEVTVIHVASQTEAAVNTSDGPGQGELASKAPPDFETPSARVSPTAASIVGSPSKDGEVAADEVPVSLQLMPPDLSALLPAKRPWMEQGPGAMALSLGAEERRVVSGINVLLERMEEQRRQNALRLKESRAQAAELQTLNEDLRSKLEVTTQRLELAISHSIYGHEGSSSEAARTYSGRSGSALAQDDEQAGLGWLMGIFARRKEHSSLA